MPAKRTLQGPTRQRIVDSQNNRCFYCGVEFGFLFPPHLDHFIPFTAIASNRVKNFVAACQDCNQIKSNKRFDSKEEAIEVIREVRKRRGMPLYELGKPVDTRISCVRCGDLFYPKNSLNKCCSPRCSRFRAIAKSRDNQRAKRNQNALNRILELSGEAKTS